MMSGQRTVSFEPSISAERADLVSALDVASQSAARTAPATTSAGCSMSPTSAPLLKPKLPG
jgi:hypothetical protein